MIRIRQLVLLFSLLFVISFTAFAQGGIKWAKDGSSYYRIEGGEITKYTLPANTKSVFVAKDKLTPAGQTKPLSIHGYSFTDDGQKLLVFTNSKKFGATIQEAIIGCLTLTAAP